MGYFVFLLIICGLLLLTLIPAFFYYLKFKSFNPFKKQLSKNQLFQKRRELLCAKGVDISRPDVIFFNLYIYKKKDKVYFFINSDNAKFYKDLSPVFNAKRFGNMVYSNPIVELSIDLFKEFNLHFDAPNHKIGKGTINSYLNTSVYSRNLIILVSPERTDSFNSIYFRFSSYRSTGREIYEKVCTNKYVKSEEIICNELRIECFKGKGDLALLESHLDEIKKLNKFMGRIKT